MMNFFLEHINTELFWWTIFIVYYITIISIIVVVLSENRNPLKSLAWVCVLIMFPIGGLILYIFFGRNIKNTRMISRRKKRKLLKSEAHSVPQKVNLDDCDLSAEEKQYVRLAQNLTGANFYPDNKVEIFHDGNAKLSAIIEDIKRAQSYIHLQYYIIEDDDTGRMLTEILKAKAGEGVKVRVIYDDIGSMHLKGSFLKPLREAGVDIYPFSRVTFPPFATRINWRNHRKVCVIDGKIGYIGGMNIANRYLDGGENFSSWRDTHLRVTGSAVVALNYSFAVDWSFMGRELLDDPSGKAQNPTEEHDMSRGDDAAIQLVTSGPTSRWSNIAMVMLKAISNAKHHVFIQTPYFLPTESLLKALQAAALAKVDVRVMMPIRSDSNMLTHASRSYIGECLKSGIKIYLYEGGMLHSKNVIVDNSFVTVGSTNFDFRSFEHNFEGNLLIYSKEVNSRLQSEFAECEKNSRRVLYGQWRRRPIRFKVAESIMRLFAPIL
ncbi:MAG: cardiolipin synthase [Muribaculaceae bacterium]|nr:cardiolipin synthase [Muribaculaceae bacterium]